MKCMTFVRIRILLSGRFQSQELNRLMNELMKEVTENSKQYSLRKEANENKPQKQQYIKGKKNVRNKGQVQHNVQGTESLLIYIKTILRERCRKATVWVCGFLDTKKQNISIAMAYGIGSWPYRNNLF